MQYDVKAAYQAGADGVMVAARTRIKGVFYSVSTTGAAIIFYDNASAASGTAVLTLPADVVGQHTVDVPGEGILCDNGVFVDINGGAAVTLFHG
jgi:hypothetical protein